LIRPENESRSPRAARAGSDRYALTRVWTFNLALAVLVGTSYVQRVIENAPAHVLAFALLGLISSLFTISLVPAGLLWSLAGTRGFAWLQAVVWMLFQMGLFIDTAIHRLFGYHFNSAAMNLFVTSGSEDSYRLGPAVFVPGFALAAGLVVLERVAHHLARTRAHLVLPGASGLRRGLLTLGIAMAVVIGVEKTLYAHAEVTLDRQLTAASQVLPLYPRLSVVPLLPESLRERLPELPAVRLGDEARPLDWPRAWPRPAADGPRPDIVVLVIDSWRGDALDGEVTPCMQRAAASALRFDDHLSGGNGTRFGVFSMLYGLHGSYWWSVLEQRRSPVLLDVLAELGYRVEVYSAASMDFPEFRSTAWSRFQADVHDEFGAVGPAERDRRLATAAIERWRTRAPFEERAPTFTFLLLDSAHQAYDFPEDDAPFRPYAEALDYFEMSNSQSPELVERVRNRYLNGLHHADRVAGRLIDELERSDAFAHTLLMVTGDHGEEFCENGYWGHTGNFTREQVAVPLFVRGPGIAPGVEARPTSHLDIPATQLEYLGADPAGRADWTLGESLFDPPARRRRVVASWTEVGVFSEVGLLRVPRSEAYAGGVSVWSHRWRPLEDQTAAFAALSGELERLDEECNRFLVPPAKP
jgi:membrane-anchored protein YejM (alkaline phosphatase superfamily)